MWGFFYWKLLIWDFKLALTAVNELFKIKKFKKIQKKYWLWVDLRLYKM